MNETTGKLYIVATPIGNARDMSPRGKQILQDVDIIAAEDTRRSMVLLGKLEIRNKLVSNHKFNEYGKAKYFIREMLEGRSVAVITDAGTPCISDPGNELIKAAVEAGIPVIGVPGCCAAVTALSVSGFDLSSFLFYGFFPRENAERRRLLEKLRRGDTRTFAFYESPKRIMELVDFLIDSGAGCRLCLCNDLTKLHEMSFRGTPAQVKEQLLAKDSIVAIGSGFSDSTDPSATTAPVETTAPPVQTTAPAQTTATTYDPNLNPHQTDYHTETTPKPGPANPSANYTGVIFASPDGKGSGKTENDPTDALTAIKNVPAGGIIYLLGGTYKYTSTILIDQNNSGENGKYKTIAAYKDAKVTFDFTGQAVDPAARGFVLDGSWWHFYGFEITQAGDNGMLLSGNNNIIEMMVFNDNEDTGLQISRYRTDAAQIADWPTNNLIKNCTSKNNCDEQTKENADGFAAKLTCGEGNVFDGCMSYNNSDDGWDLYAKEATGPIGVVTIKNCVAFRNGFTEDGRGYGDADGNGFKLGGGGVGTRHKVDNCLAFENLNCGFTDNNNPEFGDLTNCTAYNNGIGGNGKGNYFVYRCSPTAKLGNLVSYYNTGKVSKTNAPGIKLASDKFVGKMSNSVYFNNNGNYYFINAESQIASGDKKGDIVKPADSQFTALDVAAMGTDFHKAWRNADGSPNPKGFAEQNDRGYHMSAGLTQTASPAITFEAPAVQPTETTPAPIETTTTVETTTVVTETTPAPTQPAETTTTTTTTETVPTQPTGTPTYGDANKDGKLDIMDVIAVNKFILGTGALDDNARRNADVDNSGNVDANDSLNILKAVVGAITLPVQS